MLAHPGVKPEVGRGGLGRNIHRRTGTDARHGVYRDFTELIPGQCAIVNRAGIAYLALLEAGKPAAYGERRDNRRDTSAIC